MPRSLEVIPALVPAFPAPNDAAILRLVDYQIVSIVARGSVLSALYPVIIRLYHYTQTNEIQLHCESHGLEWKSDY
jgi:hypothetical protein